MMTRRQFIALASSAPAWLSYPSSAAAAASSPRMGGAPTAFSLRQQAARRNGLSFDMIEHCHDLGLGGVQTTPPSTDPEAIRKFRERLEAYNMHLVCDPRLPQPGGDLTAFEAQVKAYKDAGATALHAAMTARRYEEFDTLDAFKESFARNQAIIQAAEPILRKYRIKMAIENHKGWRSAEQAAWLKRLASEWVGVCLDFGNNLALCEDPMDTLQTLLPYIVFCHIKDMAVEEYDEGFLLSEVPMGEGFLDLKQMVQILRKKDPNMIFDLEMITRDPLKIPVFTAKYWVTFDDSYSPLPGRDLAKVLALVRKNKPRKPLPQVTGLSPEAQVKAEDDYNAQCIAWARQNLDM
jgi:3-oxoisoapionate decarboxylase